jgi:hypothetical protein
MCDDMKALRIIDWNVSYMGNADDKMGFLDEIMGDEDCIVMLQEITPHMYEKICDYYGSRLNIEYSLKYRPAGKFDTKTRKLGVAICTTPNIPIVSVNVLKRCLFPDRTLAATVNYSGHEIKVMTLHSITGCSYKKAKSVQFYSFAEAIEEFQPDIVGIDANEPKVDSPDPKDMVFFDNNDKGEGAKTFFDTLQNNGLVDSYRYKLDFSKCEEENCLTVSHIINNKIPRRYDYIYIKHDKFKEFKTEYFYDKAIIAGSDHAIVVLQV